MARKAGAGKIILMIIIILILVVGGLLWFDFLGLIHVKTLFSPVFKAMGKDPQTSTTIVSSDALTSNLDEDRVMKQREANEIREEELDKRETDIISLENQNAQIATELGEREKNLEEREKTFNLTLKQYDDKDRNIEQIANNLNGMRPEAAVAILVSLDDQTVIDVLRKVEEIASASGSSSMGAYWLSLMPPQRAAEIQRKMVRKPESLE